MKTTIQSSMADEEMKMSLLDGWRISTLGEVCEKPQYGWTTSSKSTGDKSDLKILRTTDISSGLVDWDTVPFCKEKPKEVDKYLLHPGDFVVSRAGSIGLSYLIENCPSSVFASYLIRLRPTEKIYQHYLRHFLHSHFYWSQVREAAVGIGLSNINGTKLKNMRIPLPPIEQQKKLADKLDLLLPRVWGAQKRMERARVMIRKFRQSVLDAACCGELTKDWRKSPDIAKQWAELLLGDVITDLGQGWSPKCEVQPSSSPEIWGVIKTTAIQPMLFCEVENKQLPKALKPRESLEIHSGDLLITRAGPRDRAGICCLVRSVRPKLILCDKAYRFHAIEKHAVSDFIELILNAPKMLMELENIKTGISDSGLNLTQTKFLSLPITMPPIDEQKEIVKRVRSYFEIADRVEEAISRVEASCERSSSSILRKMFSGQIDD